MQHISEILENLEASGDIPMTHGQHEERGHGRCEETPEVALYEATQDERERLTVWIR